MFDVIAGVSVGLTMIPLSTAYAGLAGVHIKTGLNTTVSGFIIYALFGTVREAFIGPSSVLSLTTYEFTHGLNNDFVVLLTFLTGCIQLSMGLLRLGFIVNYISKPVVSGFMNAVTINISAAMIPGLLGLQFEGVDFIDRAMKTVEYIKKVQYWSDVPLGLSCLLLLFILTKLQDMKINGDSKIKNSLRIVLIFISVSRNIFVILIAMGVSALIENHFQLPIPFILVGSIEKGIPIPHLPPTQTMLGDKMYDFQGMLQKLMYGLMMIPVLSTLFTVTIEKSFSHGKAIPFTREMIVISLCNIFGGLIGAMPSSGAIIACAVAYSCNVRTPIAGLYTGMLSLFTCQFLTPYMHLIPRASLSAVLIFSVIMRFDITTPYPLWRADKKDFAIMCVTMLVTLGYNLPAGLLSGIFLSILHLLYLWACPEISAEKHKTESGQKYIELTPDRGMYFPAIDKLREAVLQNQDYNGHTVINCTHFINIDFTSVKELTLLSQDIKLSGKKMVLYNIKPSLIEKCMILCKGKLPFLKDDKELEDFFLNN